MKTFEMRRMNFIFFDEGLRIVAGICQLGCITVMNRNGGACSSC